MIKFPGRGWCLRDGCTWNGWIWSDNIVMIGDTCAQTLEHMNEFQTQLRGMHLELKEDSIESIGIDSSGSDAQITFGDLASKSKGDLNLLGRVIDSRGSFLKDKNEFVKKVWRAVFRNSRMLTNPRLALTRKLELLRPHVEGLIRFYTPHWPLDKSRVRWMNNLQNKVVRSIAKIRQMPHQSSAQFASSRNRMVGAAITKVGKWAWLWAHGQQTWREHVDRHPELPVGWFRECRGTQCLVARRTFWGLRGNGGLHCGKLAWRSNPGRPVRWERPWVDTSAHNMSKDKSLTRMRALAVFCPMDNQW